MNEFDDDFNDVEVPKHNNHNHNKHNGGGYNNNNYKKSNKPKRNIIGSCDINLWDKPRVIPKEIDTDAFKDDVKIVTFTLPSDSFKLSDSSKDKIIDILKLLKKKDYKIRFVAGYVKQIEKELIEIFGKENLIYVLPFPSFKVDVDNETPLHVVSDENIAVAAQYVRNFPTLPVLVQYIMSSIISSLYGQSNDEPSEFYITYDPFLGDGRKIDFIKSRQSGNYFMLNRNLPFTMYNLADEASYADVEQVLL